MGHLDEYKKNILKESEEPKGLLKIKGFDFNEYLTIDKLIESYRTIGHQASELVRAMDIIKEMRKQKCTIFFGYTSSMVSSGLRDVFRYLAEHKLVDVIITTAGGIEEDIIKCIGPFYLGEFNLSGKELREKGINRIGNILAPNDRYCKFEDFIVPIFNSFKEPVSPSEFIDKLGEKIDSKESIYYWTHKNNIPVFCPALTDGSIGDMVYSYLFKNPNFKIEIANDIMKLNEIAMTSKKTGVIILGAGVVKHHIVNANLMRGGADYSVYINTAQEFDGSDAGALPEEAVSWGKLKAGGKMIKVFGDATIMFPLVVYECFKKEI
jgi:deoxyhypusine synthase